MTEIKFLPQPRSLNQVVWLKRSQYLPDKSGKYLVTDGESLEVVNFWRKEIGDFWATPPWIEPKWWAFMPELPNE